LSGFFVVENGDLPTSGVERIVEDTNRFLKRPSERIKSQQVFHRVNICQLIDGDNFDVIATIDGSKYVSTYATETHQTDSNAHTNLPSGVESTGTGGNGDSAVTE
jgi:hypothetical protein